MQEKEKRVYMVLLRLFYDLDVTLEEFDELVRVGLTRGIELATKGDAEMRGGSNG